ncbi:DUF6266 family protein [Pedobacter sp. MW01-1-1]|uniref:DUF6266 family protein n=1 Tax=Pedobacter sp. MW01-1-1 TaxID=3383027 RepID=UPI003FEDA53A
MAQSKDGALGRFLGKLGPVIGYELRGKNFIRSLPTPTKKKPTQAQLANREKFKILQQWRSVFTPVFAITFKNHTNERSAQNAAHAFNANIVKGEYPNFVIDASEVVISKGDLLGLPELNMQVTEKKQLDFSWRNSLERTALQTDLLTVLIWYDQSETFEANTAIAERFKQSFSYTLSYANECTFADVYLTVLSNDRERAANSVYMGRVML